jgi:glycosyltransferase involved in cell wall biosynthesis
VTGTATSQDRSSNPRILVLTTTYPSHDDDPSGIFIAKLLRAIAKRGYDVRVVAPSDGTFHGKGTVHGMETVRFGYFFPRSWERLTARGGGIPENMAQSRLARLQVLPMMIAFLWVALRESRGCDLIYANWIGSGVVGAVVNLLTGKPLVVTFRGDDGYLARDRFIWRFFTNWVTKRSGFVAPVSGELTRIMLELGVPEEKCKLFRFGVDREMFHPLKEPRPLDGEVRLLYVGSLVAKKGVQDLVEAMANPALEEVRLVVVGEGILEAELIAQCARLGIEKSVEFKGPLPPAAVADVMRSCDLLCLPSYTEGRPNVVNEAMASGLAVIATRVGGIPDMVEEGETALLFEPGKVEELRECLRRLALSPELRARMGKAGHDFLVRAGVSWDATAEDFDRVFAGLISRRSLPKSAVK